MNLRNYWGLWTVSLAIWLTIGCSRTFETTPRSNQDSPSGVAVGLPSSETDETNWPQLRGATFDSVSQETGLADSWPHDGPPVVWAKEIGQGYSSFAAVGNRIFTQTQSLYQQSVVCLDAATGDTVWTHNYGWPFESSGLYPGPRSSPTWYDGVLFFAAPDGTIACLNAETGHPVWSCNPKKKYRGRGTDFGFASSPVVVGERLIVPVGGLDASVVALNPRDGSTIWSSGQSPASYATPLPISWRGRSLVVTPLENSIAAFEVSTGQQVWEIEFSDGYDEHSAAPLYREPLLFVASPFKAGAKTFRLIDDDESTATDDEVDDAANKNAASDIAADNVKSRSPIVAWETLKLSNDVASSVLVDGRLYGFDLKDQQSRYDRPSRGEFRCLDFETGRVIWSTNRVGQANVIAVDQKLILFSDSGELILARSGTDEYMELARTKVFFDEICWTYPTLHRGRLYLRTQSRAVCLDLGSMASNSSRPVLSVKDIPRHRSLDAKWLIGGEREFPATVPTLSEFHVWYQWSLAGLVLASTLTFIVRVVQFLIVCFARSCWRKNSSVVTTSTDQVPFGDRHPKNHSFVDQKTESKTPTWDPGTIQRTLFWILAAVAGVVGSPLLNSRQQEYVLLWPLTLWVAFQSTINVITWTERQSDRRRVRWLSRGCGVLFLGTCLTYFQMCRRIGDAIQWSFLVGFLPSFLVAALAARFLTTRFRFWPVIDLIVAACSFSAYFWLSVAFIKWKMVIGS